MGRLRAFDSVRFGLRAFDYSDDTRLVCPFDLIGSDSAAAGGVLVDIGAKGVVGAIA